MFNKQKFFVFTIIAAFALFFVLVQSAQAKNAFVFNKNLQTGNVHADVKELQKFLNNNGFALLQSGVGSLGQETTFFGSATKNALIKFQKSYGVTPTIGYFGSITRKVVNNLINSDQPVGQNNNQNIKNGYFTIGGSITGITGAVILQNNNQDNITIDIGQNSNFIFPTTVASGANYNVTVKSKYPGQTCYTYNNSGVINGSNIENVKIACGDNLSYNPFTFVLSSGGSSGSGAVSYLLTYTANTGGTISGVASQTISSGGSGTTVTAIPNTGYRFVNWSDSVSTASRTDTSVTAGKSVIANFEVDSAAPSALSYTSPNLFVINTAISTLSPTVSGSVVSYSVSPTLPTGLSFNTSNGQITGTPTVSTTQSTYIITATNEIGSATTSVVIMVNGTITVGSQIWMDRNIGATRMAISSTDYLAYGDFFQWGRPADGHQSITWTGATSGTPNNAVDWNQSATTTPGTNLFYISGLDWSSVDGDGLIRQASWGINGSSNPCPSGWHVPSVTEWGTVRSAGSITNSASAFNKLRLTAPGSRSDGNGTLLHTGTNGYYWSNTPNSNTTNYLIFTSSGAVSSIAYRLNGYSVRCMKDSYTITFNTNGGDGGATAIQTLLPNATASLTANGFTKTGYSFAGWATTTSGTVAYADGASYTIGTANVTLYATWTASLAVGDSYQGGKVAYIFQSGDSGYVAGQTHGLIAATANQSTGIVWAKTANQSSAVSGGTTSTLGSGSANTDNIISQNGLDNTYAAGIARSYAGGGYSDWYLPSIDELSKLYDNRVAIGGFDAAYYWSSSEGGSTSAWSKHFSAASVSNQAKSTQWTYVRAVRSF